MQFDTVYRRYVSLPGKPVYHAVSDSIQIAETFQRLSVLFLTHERINDNCGYIALPEFFFDKGFIIPVFFFGLDMYNGVFFVCRLYL